ncbi:glycosyltransferase family 2 protein [Gramella sp. KN1008]|uniref:glycosyltransferase family 2 protein n=1 Tax=Gramella sp. KN1008 TaxID=2529298 RepID=UPI00103F74E8|nr:glycosyltransferase family 2 protein [Gramella sp. KN1008]TBW26477.1 glycosyltransferase family 2 protein [Gramella sp. KN1008]
MTRKLSILIPAFNEENTILEILNVLKDLNLGVELDKELVVVDDCSTDATPSLVESFIKENPSLQVLFFRQEVNKGKGAALHKAIEICTGDISVIQDADLEYDPEEYINLLKPILKGKADVVYGSRFMGGYAHRILFFWHSIGNKFLTTLSNAFTNLNLTDMETCYKMFRTDILKSLDLKEERFGFEPEVTAKVSRVPGIRIYEVGISYYGRTYAEGKKINWKDGMRSIWCVFRYNIFRG